MSIKVMSWVWEKSPYEGKVLLIHLAMADFANDVGECWPSQQTLADKARCTVRYVRDAIARMEEDGYVRISEVSNGVKPNKYVLTPGRNSVPVRKSEAAREELGDTYSGNPLPKNHQEPSDKPLCVYCRKRFDPSTGHDCSALNQRIK